MPTVFVDLKFFIMPQDAQFKYYPKWGSTIKIQAIPDENGANFSVNLLHSYSKQFIFHINAHYTKNFIVFDTMNMHNTWEKNENTGEMPIRPGVPFDMEITANKEEYVLKINGTWKRTFKHRHNYLHADRLTLFGDLLMIEVIPDLISSECVAPTK